MEAIVLNGRYKLINRIGIGGMAYVYEGEDLILKRKVAVKILKEDFVEDAEFVRKFENEAQSAALLNHPNIVNIYDVGYERKEGRDLHYIVMELVEGTTLKEAIQAQGQMSTEVILRISRQIASALQCAHEHGIVHRDIKPANILITKTGEVKVADFGLARLSSASTITYTNSILGTVHYISPEQAKGRYIDQKSDIYSLGVVMYEMATGHVPFDAENSVGIAIKHIQELPVPPIQINHNLHPGINAIILKCLEKDPNDRYHKAKDLIQDLNHYQDLRDTVSMQAVTDTARIPDGVRTMQQVEQRSPADHEAHYRSKPKREYYEDMAETEDKKSFKWIFLLITAAVITAVAIFLVMTYGNRRALDEATTKVPAVTNETEEKALQMLSDAQLTGEVVNRIYNNNVKKGHVISQSILAGTTADKGQKVALTVSLGYSQVTIPNVSNKSFVEASSLLKDASLSVGRTSYADSEDIEKNKVISTDPEIGTQVEAGSKINLVISLGPENNEVVVPSLFGASQSEAMETLADAGLSLNKLGVEASTYKAGTVIGQSVEAGTRVEKGTKIDIVVSSGPGQDNSSGADGSSSNINMMTYNIKLYPPEGKETFKVTIFDYNQSTSTPVFSHTFNVNEKNEDGYISQQIQARDDADLKIFYDGEPAQTSN